MARMLATNIHIIDDEGVAHVFVAGDTVPAKLAKRVTNPKAWAVESDAETPTPAAEPEPTATPEPAPLPEPIMLDDPTPPAPADDVELLDDATIATILDGSFELVISACEDANPLHVAQLAAAEALRSEPRHDLIDALTVILGAS